jgi:hypothetical protein
MRRLRVKTFSSTPSPSLQILIGKCLEAAAGFGFRAFGLLSLVFPAVRPRASSYHRVSRRSEGNEQVGQNLTRFAPMTFRERGRIRRGLGTDVDGSRPARNLSNKAGSRLHCA